MTGQSATPIKPAEIHEKFGRKAEDYLRAVRWSPKANLFGGDGKKLSPGLSNLMAALDRAEGKSANSELSIADIAKEVGGDDFLMPPGIHYVMGVLRQGLEIGMHLSKLYERHSGLETLSRANREGSIAAASSQEQDFITGWETAAASAVFSSAYYVVWELSRYRIDEVSAKEITFSGIPEFDISNPPDSFSCMLFYYALYLKKSGQVNTEIDFIKMTLVYFQAVLDEIQNRKESLKSIEAFTQQAYKLEGSEFSISGFRVELGSRIEVVDFKRVQLEEIVGNRDAKWWAVRLRDRLLSFDFEAKKNPFVELNAFPRIGAMSGIPGTGKTMLASAICTDLEEHTKLLGYPLRLLRIHPWPQTMVSTFQGGSGERADAWFRVLDDSSVITFAFIDDAEKDLEDRTRQGVSSGAREIVSVFLTRTEGALSIDHGSWALIVLTNLIEQVDPAALSRMQYKREISGAETVHDWMDQGYLWMRVIQETLPDFVDLKDPGDYEWLASQRDFGRLESAIDSTHSGPVEERLQAIFDQVRGQNEHDEHYFYGRLFHALHDEYPFFSSRDYRNIQTAVNNRLMDFDLPQDWWDNPDQYFFQSLAVKVEMLKELMRHNAVGDVKFSDLLLDETTRYVREFIRIASLRDERDIQELIRSVRIRDAASQRLGRKAPEVSSRPPEKPVSASR